MAAKETFQFGKHLIHISQVFYRTSLSYAFTNRKPVVPGHVLVACKRIVPRFHELTQEEVSDMFVCVHRISPIIQKQFDAMSLTINIQDGADAGQTVKHVHVHILPRKPGDFERNDEIYQKLEHHDKVQITEEIFRTAREMGEESAILAQLLETST